MYDNGYTPPIVTTDTVIFLLLDAQLSVLLIKRSQDPFRDAWALPGGYMASGETSTEAMARVLRTKSGINASDLALIEQLYTFDTVARDPRGHAISVTYMGLGLQLQPTESDTTQTPQFFPVSDLPELAYDHRAIIAYAQERLKSRLGYTNAIYALLPETFTFTKLQTAYEAVLGHPLDKRNFRKKFLALELLQETDGMVREGPHRPARLYRFTTRKLHNLVTSFE